MLRRGARGVTSTPIETYELPKLDPLDQREEVEILEEELFGNVEQTFEKADFGKSVDEGLFVIDRGSKRKAVWSDEEEDNREIELSNNNLNKKLRSQFIANDSSMTGKDLEDKLRSQFRKIHGTPTWTTSKGSQSSLLASTGQMTQISKTLPTKKLAVSRCKNLNARKAAKCALQSLEFHPTASVGFVAGYAKSLDLFEVDGENNKHLHRTHFTNFPIDCARFTTDGTEVILGSKRPHFYTFDLHKCVATKMAGIRNRPNLHYKEFVLSRDGQYFGFQGQEGLFAVFSAKDKQLVKCLQHRQRINCSSFLTENIIITAGAGGFCTLWDNRSWKTISEFQDDGALNVTAISHSDGHVAVGSDSGVVNIYQRDDIFKTRSTPLRAVMNLTTDIDKCVFNSTGELLAISSKEIKHSLRLVNLHSLKVVPNWPTAKTPLSHVNSVGFSPNSGYIGVGNSKGKALLYKLTHYSNY